MEIEGYSRPTYNKLVHLAITRSTVIGVIHKLTVDEFVDCTNTPMTCCGEIFLSPKCRNYTRNPDDAHSGEVSHHRARTSHGMANPYTQFEVSSLSRPGDIS